jgi:hypothetical protein
MVSDRRTTAEQKEYSMHATITAGREAVASIDEQAAVAELMAPSESLVGRPPLYRPRAIALVLLSPGEPVDEPDDD